MKTEIDKMRNILMFIFIIFCLSACKSTDHEIRHSNGSTKPDLWILGIGINNYKNWPEYYLRNPVNDTLKVVDCIKKQEGNLYGNIHSLLILDAAATKKNIINNFQYFKQAKPGDIIFLYINAHGKTLEDGTYCFYPHDIGVVSETIKVNSVSNFNKTIDKQNIHRTINTVAGISIPDEYIENKIDYSSSVNADEILQAMNVNVKTKILFLETCESGGIGKTGGINDIIIFAACGQDEDAVEDNQYGNGSVFTEGFVRKINSHNYNNSPLTIGILFDYMYNFVIELNKSLYNGRYNNMQHPELYFMGKHKDFTLPEN